MPGPEGLPTIPDHTSIGIAVGPLFGTTELLAGVLGYDAERITALRAAGALGPARPE